MKVKDLRKVLKGVSGEAELGFGNYTAYSPRTFKEKLHIFHHDLSIFNEEKSLNNDKIKEVIIWTEE